MCRRFGVWGGEGIGGHRAEDFLPTLHPFYRRKTTPNLTLPSPPPCPFSFYWLGVHQLLPAKNTAKTDVVHHVWCRTNLSCWKSLWNICQKEQYASESSQEVQWHELDDLWKNNKTVHQFIILIYKYTIHVLIDYYVYREGKTMSKSWNNCVLLLK